MRRQVVLPITLTACVFGCLFGCFFNANHEDGAPEDKLPPRLWMTATEVKLRPGTCVTLAANYDRAPANAIVDLSLLEGTGVLVDEKPGTGPRAFRLCTTLTSKSGKVTATVRGKTDHVEVAYWIVLPTSDELWRPEPLKLLGRTPFIPTMVEWSADGTTFYVAYYDYRKQKSYLQSWDAATVKPKKQWVDLGPHVHVTGPSRAVTDGDAAYVLDLDHGRSLTWLPGPTIDGFHAPDPDVPSVTQVRGVAGLGDVIAVGGQFVTNSAGQCTVASVDLTRGIPFFETTMSSNTNQFYDPLTAYVTMSPNGRYVGWGGAMGCGTEGDENSTFTQIYDLQENKRYNCGPQNGPEINITGTWFSKDGGVFAYTQDDRVYVHTLPGCTEIAQGYDPSTHHRQVAVSPDGTHIAFITWPGSPALERLAHIDITSSSPARHVPDFEGATLTLGSTDQWNLPAPEGDYNDKFHEALSYSPDGKTIAVAQLGGRIHLVDIATGNIRSSDQGLLYDGISGSRIRPTLSADGRYYSEGDAVMSLEDGHLIYAAAAAELIAEARDDGFVIEGGIPTSYTLVRYDDTSIRTPLTNYAPRVVDNASPILHRTCGLNNTGNVCIFDPGNVPFACGDQPRHGIDPSGILHWVMIGEARCAYETGGEIWTFEQQNNVTRFYATDPTRGRFSSESALMRIGSEMFPYRFVSVGATLAIWPIR